MKDEQFNIENFVQSVREFCEWAETDPCEPSKEIKTALRLLARLHLNVLQFSETNNGEDIKINKVSYRGLEKSLHPIRVLPYPALFGCFRSIEGSRRRTGNSKHCRRLGGHLPRPERRIVSLRCWPRKRGNVGVAVKFQNSLGSAFSFRAACFTHEVRAGLFLLVHNER